MPDDDGPSPEPPAAGTSSRHRDAHALHDVDHQVEPEHTAIGVVPDHVEVDTAISSLVDIGVTRDHVHVLQGSDGIELLQPGGTRVAEVLGRLLSDAPEFRDEIIEGLEHGHAALVVTHVADDEGDVVRDHLQDIGLERVHFFGTWVAE